jgi:hypothetical protein
MYALTLISTKLCPYILDLKEEGIFRVPGFVGRLNEIKKVFDSGT